MIQKSKKNYYDYGMTMDGKIVDSILPLVLGCLVDCRRYRDKRFMSLFAVVFF